MSRQDDKALISCNVWVILPVPSLEEPCLDTTMLYRKGDTLLSSINIFSCCHIRIINLMTRVKKMAQQKRACLAEDTNSLPSSHIGASQFPVTLALGTWGPLLALSSSWMYMVHIKWLRAPILINNMEISKSFKKIIWLVRIFHPGFHIVLMPWIFSVTLLFSVVPLNSGKQFSPMSFVFLPLAKSFQFLFHFGESMCEVYVCICEVYVCICLSICSCV